MGLLDVELGHPPPPIHAAIAKREALMMSLFDLLARC